MKKPNNPPAFPSTKGSFGTTDEVVQYLGMTLRDYFAGQAMMGICANPDISKATSIVKMTVKDVRDCFAESAYNQADAMLAEREKENI